MALTYRAWLLLLDRVADGDILQDLITLVALNDCRERRGAVTVVKHVAEIEDHVDKLVELRAIPALTQALWSNDRQTFRQACLALSHIAAADDDHVQFMLDEGVLSPLRTFLLTIKANQDVNAMKDVLTLLQVLSSVGE
jgi:hypothetical protein